MQEVVLSVFALLKAGMDGQFDALATRLILDANKPDDVTCGDLVLRDLEYISLSELLFTVAQTMGEYQQTLLAFA